MKGLLENMSFHVVRLLSLDWVGIPAWHKNLGTVSMQAVPGAASFEVILKRLLRCLTTTDDILGKYTSLSWDEVSSDDLPLLRQAAVVTAALCGLCYQADELLQRLNALTETSSIALHRVECARAAELCVIMATQLLYQEYTETLASFKRYTGCYTGPGVQMDVTARYNSDSKPKRIFIADSVAIRNLDSALCSPPVFQTVFHPALHLAQRLAWEGSVTLHPGLGESITGTSNLWHFMGGNTNDAIGKARRQALRSNGSWVIRVGAVDLFYCCQGAGFLRLFICDHSNLCSQIGYVSGGPVHVHVSDSLKDNAETQLVMGRGGSNATRPYFDVNAVLGLASGGYARNMSPQELADELAGLSAAATDSRVSSAPAGERPGTAQQAETGDLSNPDPKARVYPDL